VSGTCHFRSVTCKRWPRHLGTWVLETSIAVRSFCLSALRLSGFFACLSSAATIFVNPRVVADPNTTCCNCSLRRVFVDLRACRNSGGRSFGGFFGVCDAVSCILLDTGSLPFSFLRMSSSSSSRYFSPLDDWCFLSPGFFSVCLFVGKDARAVVLNAFRSRLKIIFC
jgi:hypothetical protein